MKLIFSSIVILLLTCNFKPSNHDKNPEKVFYIIEMGNVKKSDKEFVASSLKKFYNSKIKFLPKIELLKSAKVDNQDKYRASDVLHHVRDKYPNINGKILIITNVNICTNRFLNGKTHKNWSVLGLAILNQNYCIVSTKRMSNYGRLAKVSAHEIGHTFGLAHCDTPRCLMNDAKGKASTVDNANLRLCDKCNYILDTP